MTHDIEQKWNGVYQEAAAGAMAPVRVVAENSHLLPATGQALELACGMGANAIALTQAGLSVQAWDISTVAVDKLNNFARQQGLALTAQARDVMAAPPAPASFDVIVVSHYLERDLAGPLTEALKPGGLLFYQTFVRDVTEAYTGPNNPDFRLERGELLQLFSRLTPVVYREEALLGDVSQGFRNEAMLVAQRP